MRHGRKTQHERAPDVGFEDVTYIYILYEPQSLKKMRAKMPTL